MGAGILFFKKNNLDFSNENVVITASQGQDYVDFVRNRSNRSAWLTTGSVDADNTTFEVDFGQEVLIDDILLIKHNFKNYNVKYWNGSSYVNFSPAISETTNTATTTRYAVTQVGTTKILLTILGTMVANEDKRLFQFIATTKIGQLSGYPVIKDPVLGRNRLKSQMLSGKQFIRENIGNFSVKLQLPIYSNDEDLTIFEELFDSNEGFLVWLCGGDASQFRNERQAYRLEDIFLMKCTSEYKPEWYKGLYTTGQVVKIELGEVVD